MKKNWKIHVQNPQNGKFLGTGAKEDAQQFWILTPLLWYFGSVTGLISYQKEINYWFPQKRSGSFFQFSLRTFPTDSPDQFYFSNPTNEQAGKIQECLITICLITRNTSLCFRQLPTMQTTFEVFQAACWNSEWNYPPSWVHNNHTLACLHGLEGKNCHSKSASRTSSASYALTKINEIWKKGTQGGRKRCSFDLGKRQWNHHFCFSLASSVFRCSHITQVPTQILTSLILPNTNLRNHASTSFYFSIYDKKSPTKAITQLALKYRCTHTHIPTPRGAHIMVCFIRSMQQTKTRKVRISTHAFSLLQLRIKFTNCKNERRKGDY